MGDERPTFAMTWRRAVSAHANRPFLLFDDMEGAVDQWSYREFDSVVDGVVAALVEAGVRAGEAVYLVLRNCPAFIAIWLAATRMGAWIVPVDPASSARDIAAHVRRVRPAVAVIAASRAEVYREGAEGSVPRTLELSETATDLADGGLLRGDADAASHVEPSPTDQLAVMFTSGTTSEPKGVMITQANYAEVARAMAREARLVAEQRWLVVLPLFHANAQYYCFSSAIEVGASVALTARFSASRWVEQAHSLEATHASLFAAPIRMILARTPADTAPLALTHIWYAQNLGQEHHRKFAELSGTIPRQLYGMTETVAIVTADRSEPPRPDVIGPVIPGRRIKLIDPERRDVTRAGGVGELYVLGEPGADLFAGYLEAPEQDAKVFFPGQDGVWFRTGDVVALEPDGSTLRFVGRVDDVIKVAGENVSLTDVEAVVAQAPGVLEAAVVAEDDEIRGKVPVAFVVPRDAAAPPSTDALAEWASVNLTPACRPRSWHVLPDLPRTSVGKLRRSVLIAQVRNGTPPPAPVGASSKEMH